MKSLWAGEKGLTEACTWDLNKSLLQKATKNPARQHSETLLAGYVKTNSNTRELATLGTFESCSRTYCLLNAVFKVSKNECNGSCKGKGSETNILSSEIARAKTSFNYKSTKLE